MRTARCLIVLGIGGAVAACGPDPLVLPQPPEDLTALAQAYDMPTGTVDFAHLQDTVTSAQQELESRNLRWLPKLVTGALLRERERLDASGFPTNPFIEGAKNRPKLDAFATVTSPCSGWSDTAAAGGDSGSVDLTAVIDDTQLQRSVFGTASACKARVEIAGPIGVNGFIDGTVSILLQGNLPDNEQDAQVVVQITGQVGTENNIASGTFDFRLVNQHLEFRHTVADGEVIIVVGLQSIGVRGSNGDFVCDFSGASCSAGEVAVDQ